MANFEHLSQKKLPQLFYQQKTIDVAKALLGKYLVHHHGDKTFIGKIVETEAYLGEHDLACHTAKGRTSRTQIMFGPAGYAYVYLIYGMHHCFNIVTEQQGIGSAVLIRALEPVAGITINSRGPGRLSKAMAITREHNGMSMQSDALFVAENEVIAEHQIIARPRIGVDYAKEWAEKPLRFYIQDNSYISSS